MLQNVFNVLNLHYHTWVIIHLPVQTALFCGSMNTISNPRTRENAIQLPNNYKFSSCDLQLQAPRAIGVT